MNYQLKDRLITKCMASPTLMADCRHYEQGGMLCTWFRFDFCCTKPADKRGGDTAATAAEPTSHVTLTNYQI